MKTEIKSYELSFAADSDLEEIFDYTKNEFSFEQAIKYISDLEDVFHELIRTPEFGRNRDEIKLGLRSFVQASHVVFYRVLENRIRIVRVLHVSRDVNTFL